MFPCKDFISIFAAALSLENEQFGEKEATSRNIPHDEVVSVHLLLLPMGIRLSFGDRSGSAIKITPAILLRISASSVGDSWFTDKRIIAAPCEYPARKNFEFGHLLEYSRMELWSNPLLTITTSLK